MPDLQGTCPIHGRQPITALGATAVTLGCGGVGNSEDGIIHPVTPVTTRVQLLGRGDGTAIKRVGEWSIVRFDHDPGAVRVIRTTSLLPADADAGGENDLRPMYDGHSPDCDLIVYRDEVHTCDCGRPA